MLEIERKYVVISEDFKKDAASKSFISQGFLSSHPNRVVRVRIRGEQGFLTVKGRSSEDGTTRFEWESEIPKNEAEALLKLCEPGVVEKNRYVIPVGNHTFEVDEFLGENEGLVIAEVELSEANEAFEKPSWLGVEVTGDVRYYNSELSKKPYKQWN